LFELADPIEARLKTAASRVCGITPSLLARAFHGALALYHVNTRMPFKCSGFGVSPSGDVGPPLLPRQGMFLAARLPGEIQPGRGL